jgi:hypothetical protein
MSKKKPRVKQRKKHSRERRKSAPKAKPRKQNKDDLFGFMAGKFEIVGDIESLLPDWAYWHPEKNL